MEYPDNDGDGVPDAFHNRQPLSVLLNQEPEVEAHDPFTVIVEIEKYQRPPREGEWYIGLGGIEKATYNHSHYKAYVIRKVVAGDLPDV